VNFPCTQIRSISVSGRYVLCSVCVLRDETSSWFSLPLRPSVVCGKCPLLIRTISVSSGKIFGFPITRDEFAPVAVKPLGFPITRSPECSMSPCLARKCSGSYEAPSLARVQRRKARQKINPVRSRVATRDQRWVKRSVMPTPYSRSRERSRRRSDIRKAFSFRPKRLNYVDPRGPSRRQHRSNDSHHQQYECGNGYGQEAG
jgi:hypothetical protein